MNREAKALRDEVAELERKLEHRKADLNSLIRLCRHEWGPIEAAHIYTPGGTIPGDPVGTMGIDWRGPVSYPSSTEKRWKRECKNCGEVQYTKDTEKEVTERPKFYER